MKVVLQQTEFGLMVQIELIHKLVIVKNLTIFKHNKSSLQPKKLIQI